jgi:predicted pyridoxine 5'-phosphate oxidase superfamily flavin-nucleotide-binding protein
MARIFSKLSSNLQTFIEEQQLFFVATADVDGRINLSPKGLDSLRVIDSNRLLWLNLTGSGNETAAHLLAMNRMTLMFCSFAENPLILRVYGTAKTVHAGDLYWDELYAHFPDIAGARQIFDVQIDTVQTSCGYAVPRYDFVDQRERLVKFAEDRGGNGLKEYWAEKNTHSIDGKPTGMPVE